MALLTTVSNKIIDKIFNNIDFTEPTNLYVSLHTGDPGASGLNEVIGGSYSRQQTTFSLADNGLTMNETEVNYTNMPQVTVTHACLWDSQTAGDIWFTIILSSEKIIKIGDSVQFLSGDLRIGLY